MYIETRWSSTGTLSVDSRTVWLSKLIEVSHLLLNPASCFWNYHWNYSVFSRWRNWMLKSASAIFFRGNDITLAVRTKSTERSEGRWFVIIDYTECWSRLCTVHCTDYIEFQKPFERIPRIRWPSSKSYSIRRTRLSHGGSELVYWSRSKQASADVDVFAVMDFPRRHFLFPSSVSCFLKKFT